MSRVALLSMFCLGACASPPVRGEPHLEIYNVQDIVFCSQRSAFDFKCEIPDHPEGCRAFEKRVRLEVPATWDDATGWSMVFQNGLLIVRADAEAHRSVLSFLKAERRRLEAAEVEDRKNN